MAKLNLSRLSPAAAPVVEDNSTAIAAFPAIAAWSVFEGRVEKVEGERESMQHSATRELIETLTDSTVGISEDVATAYLAASVTDRKGFPFHAGMTATIVSAKLAFGYEGKSDTAKGAWRKAQERAVTIAVAFQSLPFEVQTALADGSLAIATLAKAIKDGPNADRKAEREAEAKAQREAEDEALLKAHGLDAGNVAPSTLVTVEEQALNVAAWLDSLNPATVGDASAKAIDMLLSAVADFQSRAAALAKAA